MGREARSKTVVIRVTPLEARYIARFAAHEKVTRAAWVYRRLGAALRIEAALQSTAGRVSSFEVTPAFKK